MDMLQEWFGANRGMKELVEQALLELAVREVGAGICEWGEAGLVPGNDLQPGEGRDAWTGDGADSTTNCGARSLHEVGARRAPSPGEGARSVEAGMCHGSRATPGRKWGRKGEAWHWKWSGRERREGVISTPVHPSRRSQANPSITPLLTASPRGKPFRRTKSVLTF